MKAPIGLAELIRQVKRELLETTSVDDDTPLMAVDEIELEIAISVTSTAEAGINIQVVQLGGGAERGHVHTVRVKLSPLMSHEERVAALRNKPGWDGIANRQLRATLKGGDLDTSAGGEYKVVR